MTDTSRNKTEITSQQQPQPPIIWVVIPTYNERDNIGQMIDALHKTATPNFHILIIDDSSPDGTAEIVREKQTTVPNLHLVIRKKKDGLGRAYIHGFSHALEQGAAVIVQMDADFSHDPADIPRLVATLDQNDLVIGSRYSHGISVINWPLRRLLLSVAANTYARFVTGMPYHDITGGFRAWRRKTIENLDLASIEADGYGFQIVMTHRAWKRGFKIAEIPIIFTERREGQSKMSSPIIWEAMWLVWRLRLFSK